MLTLRRLITVNLSKRALYSTNSITVNLSRRALSSTNSAPSLSALRGHTKVCVASTCSGIKIRGSSQQCKWKSTTTSPLAISAVSTDSDAVNISWADGSSTKFHNIWLRDHCQCKQCYNSATYQKEFNILDVPLDIKPATVSINDQNYLSIKWSDSHETSFDAEWLKQHSYHGEVALGTLSPPDQNQNLFLWDKKTIESNMPSSFDFAKVVSDDDELFTLFQGIIKYGFAFVNNTPTEVGAIEEMSIKSGGFVKETHYGKVWSFSNEVMQHADTAYTAEYLRGHTDSTYFTHPAGLQMLHCVGHEGTGGMNLLVDGFFAAEKLKKNDKDSFDFLTSTTLPFHYKSENLHLKAHGPIIELDPFNGAVSQIRFNNYDMPTLDCIKYDDIPRYYKALRAFTSLTCAPENQLWFKLVPGSLLVMANWRVLHGRSSFTGKRAMHGCYVNGDDFFGKYRAEAAARLNSS
ncbi:trimethyllysine dioxygenase, mitochondrial-like [Oculina patagonica]